MPRRDPRFNGLDIIRMFEKNLQFNDKRIVIAWFFSLIPVKEPKVDALQLLLDLLSLVPVAGRFSDLFQISVATAQAAKDIADLFGFEFEDIEIELARLRSELESATEEFRRQREEIRLLQIEADQQRERANALLATIELLQDEINTLETEALPPERIDRLRRAIRSYWNEVSRLFFPTGNELVSQRDEILLSFRDLLGEDL